MSVVSEVLITSVGIAAINALSTYRAFDNPETAESAQAGFAKYVLTRINPMGFMQQIKTNAT